MNFYKENLKICKHQFLFKVLRRLVTHFNIVMLCLHFTNSIAKDNRENFLQI